MQVVRNYQNAVKGIGGKVVFERLPLAKGGGERVMTAQSGGREVQVRVRPEVFSAPTQSSVLQIVEREAMQQAAGAAKPQEDVKQQGLAARSFNFDTNRRDIRPQAQATLNEVAAALQQSPSMRLRIQQHTDNDGQEEADTVFSGRRAKNRRVELVKQ